MTETMVDSPATKPICDNAIEVKITDRILGPYKAPPMSGDTVSKDQCWTILD